MALNLVIRSLPRYTQLSSKHYFCGLMSARSSSILSSRNSSGTILKPSSVSRCSDLITPVCVMKGINLNNVREFSITPNNRSTAAHDHAKLWTAERVLSTGLLVVVPAAFMFPSTAMDTLLAVSIVMHNHWGIEAVVVDYVRPIIFGSVVPKVALALTYGLSIVTLVGLFYLIFNGAGLVNTIQLFWRL